MTLLLSIFSDKKLIASARLLVKVVLNKVLYIYLTGESSSEVADEADITEHPDDDKPRPHLCTVCNKRFTTKPHLNRHKKQHTEDSLYTCTECQKRFPNQCYLRSHMVLHSSKYKCTECGKSCRNNKELTTQASSFRRETI